MSPGAPFLTYNAVPETPDAEAGKLLAAYSARAGGAFAAQNGRSSREAVACAQVTQRYRPGTGGLSSISVGAL